MDGQLRLMEGGAGAGFEFGRLEIFLRGFWSNICSGESESFTQDSAQVACRLLGYDGGASIVFRQLVEPFTQTKNPVSIPTSCGTVVDGCTFTDMWGAFRTLSSSLAMTFEGISGLHSDAADEVYYILSVRSKVEE